MNDMLTTIPLRPVADQQFDIVMNKQPCTLRLYQRRGAVYLDLYLRGRYILTGVLCRDRGYLIDNDYLGFSGNLFFVDQRGEQDPQYDGLGDRWLLMYQVAQ